MAFIEFTSKGGKFKPAISLNRTGGFGMSAGMHKKYRLSRFIGVKLYFEEESMRIGIKPLTEESEGMFKLKTREDEKGAFFSARSFLNAYSIDPTVYSGKYEPTEVDDEKFGKMFVIQLAGPKQK